MRGHAMGGNAAQLAQRLRVPNREHPGEVIFDQGLGGVQQAAIRRVRAVSVEAPVFRALDRSHHLALSKIDQAGPRTLLFKDCGPESITRVKRFRVPGT
jgi:hypothetical protein